MGFWGTVIELRSHKCKDFNAGGGTKTPNLKRNEDPWSF